MLQDENNKGFVSKLLPEKKAPLSLIPKICDSCHTRLIDTMEAQKQNDYFAIYCPHLSSLLEVAKTASDQFESKCSSPLTAEQAGSIIESYIEMVNQSDTEHHR